MRIESEIARQSRYGEDAIEAFNTAVDNGQARLAMSILVDIINAFAEKLDELTSESAVSEENVKTIEKEDIKQKQTGKEESKTVAKEDAPAKV